MARAEFITVDYAYVETLDGKPPARRFVVTYVLHVHANRRQVCHSYREAVLYAGRLATKHGGFFNNVPEDLRT